MLTEHVFCLHCLVVQKLSLRCNVKALFIVFIGFIFDLCGKSHVISLSRKHVIQVCAKLQPNYLLLFCCFF